MQINAMPFRAFTAETIKARNPKQMGSRINQSLSCSLSSKIVTNSGLILRLNAKVSGGSCGAPFAQQW